MIYFDKALEIKPKYTFSLNNKGLTLNELGLFTEAIKAFDAAIEINACDTFSIKNKGISLFKLNKYKDSFTEFERVTNINKYYDELFYNKGLALLNLKDYEEAEKNFEKLLEIQKHSKEKYPPLSKDKYSEVNYYKGISVLKQEKYKEASIIFYQLKVRDPPLDFLGQGICYYELGQYGRAIQEYDNAMREYEKVKEKNNSTKKLQKIKSFNVVLFAHYNKGIAYYEIGDYKKAIKAFDEASIKNEILIKDPSYNPALIGKGIVLCELCKYPEARQAFEKAIVNCPEDIQALTNLGKLCLNFNDFKNTSEIIEKVLKADPESAEAWCLKGQICVEKSQYKDALYCFDKAISFNSMENHLFSLWHTYARYLETERELKSDNDTDQNKYRNEIISIIWDLDKINFLIEEKINTHNKKFEKINPFYVESEKDRKLLVKFLEHITNLPGVGNFQSLSIKYKSRKTRNLENIRSHTLYCLGCLYCRIKDFHSAKQKLEECVILAKGSPLEKSACSLLDNIWNYKIRPPIWRWWWSSPNCRFRRSIFLGISAVILVSLFSFVKIGQLEEKLWFILTVIIVVLLFILILPSIERITAKGIEINLQQSTPLSIEFYPLMPHLEFDSAIIMSDYGPIEQVTKD